MSWDIEPYNWYPRFFGSGLSPFNRSMGFGLGFGDILREYDEMQREMERMFDDFEDIEKNAPKELVREYETQNGRKVREVGAIVYGYSMTVGPDGKPRIKEFGNVKHPLSLGGSRGKNSIRQITAEREAMSDISITDKEVKVTVEMPGVGKENIKINAYDSSVEVKTDEPQRKYHQVIDLPQEADIETAKSSYNNGILEITFNKKKSKIKGKEIKVE